MDTFNLQLPKFLHTKVLEMSRKEKISVNKFIAYALAEKISALMTREYVEELVHRVSRQRTEQELLRISANNPEMGRKQELPSRK